MTDHDISPIRRNLLKGLAGTGVAGFVGAIAALQARQAGAVAGDRASALVDSPYGPVAAVKDITTGLPLLKLPAGFSYKSFGWRGDTMLDGRPCPGGHDGMGVVLARQVGRSTELVLVRNHRIGGTPAARVLHAPGVYDAGALSAGSAERFGGGATSLVFRDGNWVSMTPSLGGTHGNSGGGVTPWGTWLSCEETGLDVRSGSGRKHGYVFEVHPDPALTTGQPIVGMGRFAHEAAAVDPVTNIVYLTEDAAGKSGFYRYIPDVTVGAPGSLGLGGVLQMAKVKGYHNVNLASVPLDAAYELEWVTIARPDADRTEANGPSGVRLQDVSGPFAQGWRQGAARMNRGEGLWYADGKVYVMDTAGGGVRRGSIWELDLAKQVLTCIFSSPDPLVGNMGDNLTVSPNKGILVCEDASALITDHYGFGQRLMGLTAGGDAYIFAKNNFTVSNAELEAVGKLGTMGGDHRDREFAGACFDPSGRYLFVNLQTPGITFAITGPWAKGPL